MKLKTTPYHNELTGLNAHIKFKVAQSAAIFRLMSTNLYTRPEEAVVRELSANALDSHKAAGKEDAPFDVHFPTAKTPYFVVRDYGIGLSPEKAETVYSTIFLSDKSDSNDMVGAFGLGAISFFSISDKATIESWHNGIKYTWICYMGDDGVPVLSSVNPAGEPSSEPSGVRVTVPVKSNSIYAFGEVSDWMYKFFKVQPIGNYSTDTIAVVYKDENYTVYKDSHNTDVYIEMGGISYVTTMKSTLNRCVVIHANIGDVTVETNREGLHYNETTKTYITDKLKELDDRLYKQYEVELKTCNTKWAELITNATYNSSFPGLIKYHPLPLDEQYGEIKSISYRGLECLCSDIPIFSNTYFIVRDYHKSIKSTLEKFERTNSCKVLLINNTVLPDSIGAPKDRVVSLRSLQPKGTTGVRTTGVVKNISTIHPRDNKSEAFTLADSPKIAYYVVRKGNDILWNGKELHPKELGKILDNLKSIGLVSDADSIEFDGFKIYAVLQRELKNLPSGAVEFSKFATTHFKDYLNKVDWSHYNSVSSYGNDDHRKLSHFKSNNVIANAIKEYSEKSESYKLPTLIISLLRFLGTSYKIPDKQVKCSLERVYEKIPFLNYITAWSSSGYKDLVPLVNKLVRTK